MRCWLVFASGNIDLLQSRPSFEMSFKSSNATRVVQCFNWKQLMQQTNKCNNYYMTERPCLTTALVDLSQRVMMSSSSIEIFVSFLFFTRSSTFFGLSDSPFPSLIFFFVSARPSSIYFSFDFKETPILQCLQWRGSGLNGREREESSFLLFSSLKTVAQHSTVLIAMHCLLSIFLCPSERNYKIQLYYITL